MTTLRPPLQLFGHITLHGREIVSPLLSGERAHGICTSESILQYLTNRILIYRRLLAMAGREKQVN